MWFAACGGLEHLRGVLIMSWYFFVLNEIIQLNAVSSTGKACWFCYILKPLGMRLFDNFTFPFLANTPAIHWLFYLGSKKNKSFTDCMLSSSSPPAVLSVIDLSSAGLRDKPWWHWQKHTYCTCTQTDFHHPLCHLAFPDHSMQWLNIKALWKERIICECSCGMQQNATHGDGFLWLHTIVMSVSANNGGVCILSEKENKSITVKKDVILRFPHCSEALSDGRLPPVGPLPSHLPKLWKLISVLETVVSHFLSTARSWIMNWSMKDAPLPADIMG